MSVVSVLGLRGTRALVGCGAVCAVAAFGFYEEREALTPEIDSRQHDQAELLADEIERLERMTRERVEHETGPVAYAYRSAKGDIDAVDSAIDVLGAYVAESLDALAPTAAELRAIGMDEAEAWRFAKYADYGAYRKLVRLGPALGDLYYEAQLGRQRLSRALERSASEIAHYVGKRDEYTAYAFLLCTLAITLFTGAAYRRYVYGE